MEQSVNIAGKKIVILFGNLEMGGAERQGLLVARYLQEQCAASVEVWGLGAGSGPVAAQCDAWGIPWRSVRLHWGLRRRVPHLLRLLYLLRRTAPDLLLSYTRVPNLAAALLWRLAGCRSMVWNQADAGLLLPSTWLHRLAIARARFFIANAEGGRQYLLNTFGLAPQAVRLIRNGIQLDLPVTDRPTWRERLGCAEDTCIAVMVANLSSYKDHATLLEAWRLVLDRWSGPLPLLALAGRFDDRAEALQRQAIQLGVAEQVRFMGDVTDISGLLVASDLCVHSSPSEGIPNAVVEAMAAGLPVTGSDIPGMREAVGDEGVVLLAPPGDAAALAAILQNLMADPAQCRQQGALMRRRAAELFGRERMCRETVSYVVGCLEQQS